MFFILCNNFFKQKKKFFTENNSTEMNFDDTPIYSPSDGTFAFNIIEKYFDEKVFIRIYFLSHLQLLYQNIFELY